MIASHAKYTPKSSLVLLLNLLVVLALLQGSVSLAARPPANELTRPENVNTVTAVSPLRTAAHIWDIKTVVGEGNNTYPSLALDKSDKPHISWYSNGLRYAWNDGIQWHFETVDNNATAGEYSSLALDSLGRPHISYYGMGKLNHAWRDNTTGWQTEIVDEGDGSIGQYTSLALDKLDQPHIGYYDFGHSRLKYAWREGATWHTEVVDDPPYGCVGPDTSLALDGANRPHIAYLDCENGNLKYAWREGMTWHIETLFYLGWASGFVNSLAVDSTDRPHVCYWDTGMAKHAWRAGMTWYVEDVGSDCACTSMVLDRFDQPNVTCHDFVRGWVKYGWRDGTGWHIEMVDGGSSNISGWYHSLALDSEARPHISYIYSDGNNDELRYASTVLPLLLDKQATPEDGLHNSDILTYTLVLSGPGLNIHLWDPLPTNTYYVTGSIAGTIAPSATYSVTANAISWQGTLLTDTLQTIQFQVALEITNTGALSLVPPIVNTGWLTVTQGSWSTSATVIVNGKRVYLPLVFKNQFMP